MFVSQAVEINNWETVWSQVLYFCVTITTGVKTDACKEVQTEWETYSRVDYIYQPLEV